MKKIAIAFFCGLAMMVAFALGGQAPGTATSNFGYYYNPAVVAITGGSINGTTVGATTPSTGSFTTLAASGTTSTTYSTPTNCAVNSVSPAACGTAAAGAFVVPTTTGTYTVNTSAVTAHSRIILQPITFAADLPSSPSCVAPLLTTDYSIGAVSTGVSFTLTLTSTTGQTCWYYTIIN